MFIISHAATGYLSAISLKDRLQGHYKTFLITVVAFSLIPDVDGIFSPTVAGHHSILHTPIFWIVVSGLVWVKHQVIALGMFLGSMLHLVTDWITARTVGIAWLYPFSNKNFHLYEISPEKGQIPVFEMVIDPYWSFYMENRVLFGFEIGIIFLALFFLVKQYQFNKTKGIS